MKIAIAQIRPVKGNIEKNIDLHKDIIALALTENINAVFFSELSITSYEPELAKDLKMDVNDTRLNIFQHISNKENITIGIGTPTKFEAGVQISMLIFQPHVRLQKYSKQLLHDDEKPYFKNGDQQIIIQLDKTHIAPAICYESLQKEHLEQSIQLGADIYLASTAKSQQGIDKANLYFPKIAREKAMPVLMSNCVGYCDNFESAGQSMIWNKHGNLIGQLSKTDEGILVYDTKNEIAIELKKKKIHLFATKDTKDTKQT